jgi:uncharacterized membrane protein
MYGMKTNQNQLTRIVFGAVMAAIICVITLFRIPLGQSKVHFANAMCLLAGLLLGPVTGGLSAGLGSALYDVLFGGYGPLDAVITFVSKFAMAWVCGMLAGETEKKQSLPRILIACVCGALTYVALYMLKTGIYGLIAGNIWAPIVSKFPASIINAGAAVVAAPVFYHALRPALKAAGILSGET